jgi:ATP-dependent helicase Lhr and Lhr-like helicase
MTKKRPPKDPLARFQQATQAWFRASCSAPTPAQEKGWPSLLDGASTPLLAPTGSGKTLAAFLAAIDRLEAERALLEGSGLGARAAQNLVR